MYVLEARPYFMKEIIQKAFRKIGLFPINQHIFTEKDFAPSKTSSSKVHVPDSFPAKIPSSDPAIPTSEGESDSDYMDQESDIELLDRDYNENKEIPAGDDSEPNEEHSINLGAHDTDVNSNIGHDIDVDGNTNGNCNDKDNEASCELLSTINEISSNVSKITRSARKKAATDIRVLIIVSYQEDARMSAEKLLDEVCALCAQLHSTYNATQHYQAQLELAEAHCTIIACQLSDV
jgi:hypothetical protein